MLTAIGRRRWISTLRILGVVFAWSGAAFAQAPPNNHVALTLTAGARATTTDFSQSITFEAFSEEGSITSNYTITHRPVVDGSITVRIWRGFGAAVAGTYLHGSFPARVTALIPHPLAFNQPRTITGDAGVDHRESAAHLQAVYWLQAGHRLDVLVSGGPSVIRAEQDFVSDVAYSQTFPYNTATFEGATAERQRKTAIGVNVGAEAGWRLVGPFGVAAVVRYSRVTDHFPVIGATSVPVGGLNVTGGVRLLF